MREDLKALPDDLRASRRKADRKLDEAVKERPALGKALDIRVPLVASTTRRICFK